MHMNPVYKNELKMSARSVQLPVLAVVFNSILSVIALMILYGIQKIYIVNGVSPYHYMMMLYVGILTIEVLMLCLFVPSSAGGSVAGERERQTLDILLASKMTVREIVTGKLLSCISMAFLLIVTSLPVLAVTSLYGGMHLGILYQSAAYVGFFILFIGSIGVFCSCRFKKTTYASISAYGIILILTVGTALLVFLLKLAMTSDFGGLLPFSVTTAGGSVSYSYNYFMTDVSDGHAIFGVVYLWLLNPAVTYAMLIFHQIGGENVVECVLEEMGAAQVMIDHWMMISLVVQTLFILLMIYLAAKYLDPKNERFKVHSKILKKHKTR